jgi:NodT family efflux transporter outer membrane factor (OMF) lipoprotein
MKRNNAMTFVKRTRLALGVVAVLAMTGCEVGPNYKLPLLSLPESWLTSPAKKTKPDPQQQAKATLDQAWWKNFHDPVLDKLVAAAAAGNYDLKIAETRIAEARAGRAEATAGLLPTVNADGSAVRQANRISFPGEGSSSPSSKAFNLTEPFNTFQAGFDASWELDLFGGTRRRTEAAQAKLEGAWETAEDTRLRLMAETARGYIDVRHAQSRLAVLADTEAADTHTAELARELFRAGRTAHADVTRADQALAATQAERAVWRNSQAQAEFSLDALLGAAPGAVHKLISASKEKGVPSAAAAPLLAAPAKVIASRPDLRSAERALAAATAQQGVATAALFPKISLSGFLGLLNVDSARLLQARSVSWSESPSFVLPIFDFGKLRAELHIAKAQKQEALFSYEKSVIAALSDVESALSAYAREEEHRQSLKRVVEDAQRTEGMAQERYKQGQTSFLDVLDAQRGLYGAKAQLVDSDAQTAENLVALYKSLGGGWKAGAAASKAPDKTSNKTLKK